MNWGAIAMFGAGLLGERLTRPDAPKILPYNPKPIAERLEEIDPSWDSRMGRINALADTLMSGEIPQETQDQIEMLAAENAWRGGFGMSERAGNLTARDLGLYTLDLMKLGAGMAQNLTDFQAGLALSDAEMAYESYARRVNMQLASYKEKSSQHANLWSAIFREGGGMISNEEMDTDFNFSSIFGGGSSESGSLPHGGLNYKTATKKSISTSELLGRRSVAEIMSDLTPAG